MNKRRQNVALKRSSFTVVRGTVMIMAMHQATVEEWFLIANMSQATVGHGVGVVHGFTLGHASSVLHVAQAFAARVEVAREFLNSDDSSVEKRMA